MLRKKLGLQLDNRPCAVRADFYTRGVWSAFSLGIVYVTVPEQLKSEKSGFLISR